MNEAEVSHVMDKVQYFKLVEENLYFVGENSNQFRLVVPESRKSLLFNEYHSGSCANHACGKRV